MSRAVAAWGLSRKWVVWLALAALTGLPARAATLDQLKGHSFEVSYTRILQFQDSQKSIQQQWVDRFYVGRAGTIFDYMSYNLGPAGSGSNESAIATERARSIPWGRMKAWDMQGGNLIKIIQLPEGDLILTVAVDPSLSRCTFGLQARPDPSTRRIIIETPHGAKRQVASMGLASYVCTVKQGNVFAADQ